MSWFNRSGPLRTSLRRSHSPSLPRDLDANACLESFKMHWQQVLEIINKQGAQSRHVRGDNVRAVMNHVDQMVTLLLHDVQVSNNGMGPILDYLLTEDILDKIFLWSTKLGENVNAFKLEQLKLYEVLISHSHQPLLIHKPILTPLLKLLQACSECGPVEVEKRLVILLNQLCVSLTQNATLMDFFFSISLQQSPSKFLIFNLLIPFVHREGGIGQQARDALLLCMSLSRKNESLGLYIAEHSNFCPILATGLSGLYSLLPRKLVIETEDWHQLTPEDIHDIPELAMFMNSFEFCNAVIQVSYPTVQEQLLEYLYQGFLVPVLGPALHQGNVSFPIENVDWPEYCSSSTDEIITATAYLDLFLRSITEASLLQTFLHFIFKERHEGAFIIDTITSRIPIQSRLCIVTLALFRTLLELNCEDVMFHLVFRYLIPCTHVMVSQRCRIKDFDIYCKTAEKFLALIPSCCQPIPPNDENPTPLQGSPVHHGQGTHRRSFTVPEVDTRQRQKQLQIQQELDAEYQTSYLDYLREGHKGIVNCMESCSSWVFAYDGDNPSPEQFKQFLQHKDQQLSGSTSKDKPTDESVSNGAIDNGDDEIRCDAVTQNEPEGDKTDNASITGEEKLSSKELLKDGFEVDESSNKNDLAANEHVDGYNGVEFDEDISPLTNDLTEMDEDERFWAKLDRCQTPPIANIEESFHEIDLALGWLEMKYYKSHSFSNSPQKVIGQDSATDIAVAVTESMSSVELRLLPEIMLPVTSSLSQEKSSLHNFHGYSESFGEPDTGPFLGMLFNKLENMMNNNLYINLQLTGVIARLAYFPQPLLRSFLLNHTLVFQPTVRSLLQILGTLKQKLDNYSSTVDNFHSLLCRARKFLKAREERFSVDGSSVSNPQSESGSRRRSSSPDGHRENKRRSFADILFRKPATNDKDKTAAADITLDGIPDGTGYRYINRPFPDAPDGKLESLKTKNAVLCAVVLEEFLKELSAITQEHTLAEIQDENLDSLFRLLEIASRSSTLHCVESKKDKEFTTIKQQVAKALGLGK